MKLAVTVLVTLALLGCSRVPTSPAEPGPIPTEAPTPPTDGKLWGMVLGESGACILGATVQVIRGEQVGKSTTQATPCDAWGVEPGFEFSELTPGSELTLRASAPGYVSQEKAFPVTTSPWPPAILTLSRLK